MQKYTVIIIPPQEKILQGVMVIEGAISEISRRAASYERQVSSTIGNIFSGRDPISSLETQKEKIQELFSFARNYLKDDEDAGFFSFLLFWRKKQVIPFREEVKRAEEQLQNKVIERAKAAEKIAEDAFQIGSISKSLALYERLFAVFSKEGRFQERIGDCFFRLFQYERAIKAYEALPERAIAQVKKIRAFCAMKKIGGILPQVETLLADRNIVGWPRQKLFLSKIEAMLFLGRFHEAISEIQDAAEDLLSDELFDRLLDAYFATSFSSIFQDELIAQISKRSCYCPLLVRQEDRMQIEWDVIEYYLRTKTAASAFSDECFAKYRANWKLYRKFIEIVRLNIKSSLALLDEKLESFNGERASIKKMRKKAKHSLELSFLMHQGQKADEALQYIRNLKNMLYRLGGNYEILRLLRSKEKDFQKYKDFFELQALYFGK
jgi:hypothetical protein